MNLNAINQIQTPLNTAFFCQRNQDTIQRGLRQHVLNQYKVRIDNQSPDAILALMRMVFINNSSDPYGSVQPQVRFMNGRVIEMATTQVASGVAQHYGYLRDIDRPLQPPPTPRNTSLYGVKIGYNTQIGL
jgi:hypothetical protein